MHRVSFWRRPALAGSLLFLGLIAPSHPKAQAGDGTPVDGPLATKWAKDVKPESPLPEYPRPQMVRTDWANLNGAWQFAFGKEGDPAPVGKNLADKILVPFPVESALSGIMKMVPDGRAWYRRTFSVPAAWRDRKLVLHFGAVDWESTVWVNGKELGTHKGGYDGFDYDITDALNAEGQGDQEVIVRVFDPTDGGTQPRGKQVNKPGGIFYTPTTGIWQTVWLEPVAKTAYINDLKIVTDIDANQLVVTADVKGTDTKGVSVSVVMLDEKKEVGEAAAEPGKPVAVAVGNPKLWSPSNPFLYGLKVQLTRDGKVIDTVESYAGMRKISLMKDAKGVNRIALNNQPIFQVGPLDQGFWPEGLYTAPTDEALKYDVEITKKLGFNMTRKHVKVEPDRWYYWCDRAGLLVWQDMPSGDKSIGPDDPDITRSPESAKQYDTELKAMIDGRQAHPCIVTWVPFNEGWGQFDTKRVAEWIQQYDPTRLVDAVSGWADRAGVGDMHDYHHYPRPAAPPLEPNRAGVLGEFGGLALGVTDHFWQKDKNWGYQQTKSGDELTRKYEQLIKEGYGFRADEGLNALVYTQITDVETEINGILTYDRAILKMDLDRVQAANAGDFSKVADIRPVVATSQKSGLTWRYTTDRPTDGWEAAAFDSSSWQEGEGVLGTKNTPGAEVRTTWDTPDIWARRSFDLPAVNPNSLLLGVLHDEDAEVYLNGVLAAKLTGYTSGYDEVPISPEATATLKTGQNVMAVHCHQTAGGQAIDIGIMEIREPKAK